MEELTFGTLIAVLEEMFGRGLFWGLVVIAALVTAAFVYVIVRDRSLRSRWFLRAELLAPIGAIAAIWFVFVITRSGLGDVGGPIDVIALIMIGLAGAVGLTFLAYTVQAVVGGKRGEA
ncbi:hypothetical protein DEM25_004365 [Oceaniradius stylonematis]|jgi:bacteriorhodopsin|uniref:DUF5368 domain-containing protein n=1 Tax=Oceaniradius stylonematis TaxID=2184161 RepID=A0A3A8ADK8_9HYPH|nr:DUF5368 domain-containing protein [Oceaniradius stylonematis]RKF07099.1 hypothetical protein DEM25_004365 [Oceaniradius stylonematis]RNC96446.1 MAG: hypothetical protein ED558_00685 [Oricola sp.]